MTHPNALAALERHRPYGLSPNTPRCTVIKRNGKPCRAARVKGRSRCYCHGGASYLPAKTPQQVAARALFKARRMGLIPPELMAHPAWIKACERLKANVGARLEMLSAWGAEDPEAWARAVQSVV
jgi:hypothetical protein